MKTIKVNKKQAIEVVIPSDGGVVESAYGDLANSIATLRIEEAYDTNADLIVTSCPFCKLHLSENSDYLEVLDLSEFVLKILKNDESPIKKESINQKED